MRKGRGIDHSWEVRRYYGDIALYAHCRCGFSYVCSSNKRNEDGTWSLEQEITKLYHYCPNCGAHKKYYNEIPIKIDKMIWE
jgi:rubredoxin